MNKKILVAIFTLVALAGRAQGKKTFLFIGAHPDDETAIAEVLVKYRQQGFKTIVMFATDGKGGTRVTNIPAGDSLGTLRRQEAVCACEKLGIEPPVFLGIERLDTRIGVGRYFSEHARLLDTLKKQLLHINPDVIVTFGPDGDTHHSEHIVVGSAVTELLLREGWVEKFPLYYFAWTKSQGEPNRLGYVKV